MYVFALFLQQSLVGYLQEETAKPTSEQDLSGQSEIFKYFGSVKWTMATSEEKNTFFVPLFKRTPCLLGAKALSRCSLHALQIVSRRNSLN